MRQTKQERSMIFAQIKRAEELAFKMGLIGSTVDNGSSQTLSVWNTGVLVLVVELHSNGLCTAKRYKADGTLENLSTTGPEAAVYGLHRPVGLDTMLPAQ